MIFNYINISMSKEDRQSLLTVRSTLTVSEKLIEEYPSSSSQILQKPAPIKQRFVSLDILRGLTIMGMLIVDDLYPQGPWWITHPQWNGFTFADLIFPSFVFIMGMAVPLSLSTSKPFTYKNLIRILGLFAIGLLLNLFEVKFNFYEFRVMGILQRISLCYGLLCLVHVITRYGQSSYRYIGALITTAFAMIYLTFMLTFEDKDEGCTHSNNLSPKCNFGSYVDRKLFGQKHMYDINDPEGLFTTLTAFINGYAGYWFCLTMFDYKTKPFKIVQTWIMTAALCGLIALPLVWLMPLNKKIWSISYTFLTIAISGISLAIITILVDMVQKYNPRYQRVVQIVSAPFVWFGMNPLAIFVSRDFLDDLLNTYIVIDDKQSFYYIYHYVFGTWISNQQLGSVLFSLLFLLIFTLQAFILHRNRIFIKL